MIQVALAAMEAHQRTSSLAGSGWSETVGAERVQLQQLRFAQQRRQLIAGCRVVGAWDGVLFFRIQSDRVSAQVVSITLGDCCLVRVHTRMHEDAQ